MSGLLLTINQSYLRLWQFIQPWWACGRRFAIGFLTCYMYLSSSVYQVLDTSLTFKDQSILACHSPSTAKQHRLIHSKQLL